MAFKFTKLIEKTIKEILLTLLALGTTRVQYPRCDVTIHATSTQLLLERPTRSVYMRTRSNLGAVLDHNLTFVAHTKLKTRMGSNRLARQLLSMLEICKNPVLF